MMVDNLFSDMWEGLVSRTTGPLKFRFFLQPSVAIFLAIRAGLRDWRQGKVPFFWDFVADGSKRKELFRDFRKSVGKLFLFACLLDCIYQLIVLHLVHPFEAVIVATLLAVVPYLLVRGPVNRIATGLKLPVHEADGRSQSSSPPSKARVL
jgi:hypothetical protein